MKYSQQWRLSSDVSTGVSGHVMWEDNYESREDRLGKDVVEENVVAEDWGVEDRTQGEWSSLQKILSFKR